MGAQGYAWECEWGFTAGNTAEAGQGGVESTSHADWARHWLDARRFSLKV